MMTDDEIDTLEAGYQTDAVISRCMFEKLTTFRFSTNISDAMYLTWLMEQRGFWCQMRTPFGIGKDDDGYWAGFTPHQTTGWNERPDHNTSAPTLPLAICRAALKTIYCQERCQ